jgi:DNA polymerase-3 subunit gamma/tau
LRKKLQQSQAEMEEKALAGKKSVKTEVPNLASIRQPHALGVNKNSPVIEPIREQEPPLVSQEVGSSSNVDDDEDEVLDTNSGLMPPWDYDDRPRSNEAESLPTTVANTETSQDSIVEAYSALDAHGHLALNELGEVSLEIPVFLDNKQKVISAVQVDQWSQLIDSMQITALTKQLALHSSFEKVGDTVKLTLLHSKGHLDTPSARQQLGAALISALNADLRLEIDLGHPINTPFAIQQKVNNLRQEYAQNVINTDANIGLMQELFAARVDNASIIAR